MGASITRRMEGKAIAKIIAECNPDALLADGFDDALVGFTTGFLPGGKTHTVAVYDREKCIEVLMKRDGVSIEDAEEFFSFNTEGAYVGEHGPIFVEFPQITH